jgi:hydrogenase-4 component B
VDHSAHTRQIERLGGLAKTMPWTAAMFLVGAVAICGLPPLNGFVSELFVYLGLFRTLTLDGSNGSAAVIAVPVLAMIGALAVACFVKVYGAVFLGQARTSAPADAHESPVTMWGPMLALAACCALIGLAPALVSPMLDNVIASWWHGSDPALPSLGTVAPLKEISAMSVSLVVLVSVLTIVLACRGAVSHRVGTWDCGYARPASRMQYTASSFAQMIVGMFGWVLRPHTHRPRIDGLFPAPTEMESHVNDAVLDRLLVPAAQVVARWFSWLHRFQQGLTQHYVLYILTTVILMLSTLIPIDEFLVRLFTR